MDKIAVNQKEFEIIKLLGKGKGGYSYLCKDGQKQVVVSMLFQFVTKLATKIVMI